MKNIEINNKQKENLLEMCKALFPDYFYWELDHHIITAHIKGNDDEIYEDEPYDIAIHWFELCLIHLAPKILDNSCGDNETSELGYFGYGPDINEDHPVDYLYEEFKKLK